MDAVLDSQTAADQLLSYLYSNNVGQERLAKVSSGWIGTHYIQSTILVALCDNLKKARDREKNKLAVELQNLNRKSKIKTK